MGYTEEQLICLAQTNPKELARLLVGPNADIRMLTIGVEILGAENSDEQIVYPVLINLIKHNNAIVREGAAMGLSSFYLGKIPPQDILDKLKIMALNDPSPSLRDYAKTLLEDFES